MVIIGQNFPIFNDLDGTPLQNGAIYFGSPNLNPETTPIVVYWDFAGTQPASQPLQTINGVIVRDGTQSNVYCAANYSVTVRNKKGLIICSLPDSSVFSSSTVGGQNSLKIVPSITALKALSSGAYNFAWVEGYYAAGDGGGGFYWYDATDTTSPSNLGTIIVATDNARWKLSAASTPTLRQFGAKGDGVTDDTLSAQAARATGYMYATKGVYKITDYTILQAIEKWTGDDSTFFLYNTAQLPIGKVTAFTNLAVPSVFASIQDAVTFVQAKTFANQGFISINVADGTYYISSIEPQFPNGSDRVQIIGNQTTPDNCIIYVDNRNNAHGFSFLRGNSLYLIDGFTIIGQYGWISLGVWNTASYGAGIFCLGDSRVTVGSNMRINKMYYGVAAHNGAFIGCLPGVIVQYAGDCGFHAYGGASVEATSCQAFHTSHIAQSLGTGFCAEGSSFMDCSQSSSAYNNNSGFLALTNSSMWAHSISSSNNGAHGVYATEGGAIECNPYTSDSGVGAPSNSYSNAGNGYYAENKSFINCNSALGASNAGSGALAINGSILDITASIMSNNSICGYAASNHSTITGNAATANNNTSDGFNVNFMSMLNGSGHSTNNNHNYGLKAFNMSFMQATTVGGVGNTAGFCTPTQNTGTPANVGSYIYT